MKPENTLFPLLTVLVAMIIAGLIVKFIKGPRSARIRIAVYFFLAAAFAFLGLQRVVVRPMVIRQELVRVANDLIKIGESKSAPNLGTNLSAKLQSLRAKEARVANIRWGDAPPPLGDGTATAQVLITNRIGEAVGIRFRYKGSGQFEPLGFHDSLRQPAPAGQ